MQKLKSFCLIFITMLFCVGLTSCNGKKREDKLAYLKTLKQQSNVAVSEYDYIYFTEGYIPITEFCEVNGLDNHRTIAVSREYIFLSCINSDMSDIYKVRRDLTDLQKIIAVPKDRYVYDYTLYYTEEDGKHYIFDLLTEKATYVGDDDSYYSTHFEAERKYTVEKAGFWSKYYKVKNTETGENITDIKLSSFSLVPEIAGSVLSDDISTILDYCYYGDDIYFCVGTLTEPMFWKAVLIFKYSPTANAMSYYSWIDTSVYGDFTGGQCYIFDYYGR